MGFRIGDLDWGLGFGIGDCELDWGLDWVVALGIEISDCELRLGIENWDSEFGIGIEDWGLGIEIWDQ